MCARLLGRTPRSRSNVGAKIQAFFGAPRARRASLEPPDESARATISPP